MTGTISFFGLFFIATGAFAQHSGMSAGGFAAAPGAAFGRVTPPHVGAVNTPGIRSAYGTGARGHRFGYGNRSGYGYFAPYYPFYGYGYDQSFGGYREEYAAGGNTFVFPP